MAIFSKSAIRGTTITPEPMLDTISIKPSVVFPFVTLNGGGLTSGSPGGMYPINTNGDSPSALNMYPITPHITTKIAFLDVPTNQKSLLTTFWKVVGWAPSGSFLLVTPNCTDARIYRKKNSNPPCKNGQSGLTYPHR